jgi:hypothetical protein
LEENVKSAEKRQIELPIPVSPEKTMLLSPTKPTIVPSAPINNKDITPTEIQEFIDIAARLHKTCHRTNKAYTRYVVLAHRLCVLAAVPEGDRTSFFLCAKAEGEKESKAVKIKYDTSRFNQILSKKTAATSDKEGTFDLTNLTKGIVPVDQPEGYLNRGSRGVDDSLDVNCSWIKGKKSVEFSSSDFQKNLKDGEQAITTKVKEKFSQGNSGHLVEKMKWGNFSKDEKK